MLVSVIFGKIHAVGCQNIHMPLWKPPFCHVIVYEKNEPVTRQPVTLTQSA
jgi:hypothetical protein